MCVADESRTARTQCVRPKELALRPARNRGLEEGCEGGDAIGMGRRKRLGRAGSAALANGKAGGALHCRVCAQMVPLWRFIFYRPLVVSYKVFDFFLYLKY